MELNVIFSAGFSGGVYGLYLIFGFLIRRGWLKKCKSIWLAVGALIFYAGVVCVQIKSYHNGISYNVWYDSVLLFLCAVCLFELLSRVRRICSQNLIYYISRFSFAVYLIHVPVLLTIKTALQGFAMSHLIRVAICFVSVLAISFVIATVISKIPRIGKFLLYMK